MSAGNWAECPRCKRRLGDEAVRLRSEADSAYGIASLEEWKEKDAAATSAALTALSGLEENTFREDYEIGVFGETFFVSYFGECSKCGLSHSFKHDAPVEGVGP
jgi:hypothetical protein